MTFNKDQLKFNIQRYDNYINGANTKGAFLLAFNTFICGGLLTNYSTLTGLIAPPYQVHLKAAIILIILAGIASLIVVLLAIYPFLTSGNSSQDKYHSLLYFGSVAQFADSAKFKDALAGQNEEGVYDDLVKQTYLLSKGLFGKFKKLEWATKIVFFQLAAVLFCVTLIVFQGR